MTLANKFGMFIHWGIYALTQLQEQALARYDLPRAEYEALRLQFDPQQYDPESWVLLAKQAGMEYICFTTKHHDGFCMWDTKYTDYNIMHTPYGKDVLKMLADACQKHGMLLSLYYSNPDWHHPKAYNPASSHQWRSVDKSNTDLEEYKKYICGQITELLTNYGKIYTLFWDIPPMLEDPAINALARKLQPGIYINDRGFDAGDFSTPEREYSETPKKTRFERMTEACNSVDPQSWGYRADADFYSCGHLQRAIDRVMARGGSYLLNVGPRADGTIDPVHAQRIRQIGDWYTRMEGCLVCHEADDYPYEITLGGDCIATKKNGKTYLHFFNGISATALAIRKFPGVPERVRLMNTGEQLPATVQVLPGYNDPVTGKVLEQYLYIRHIPVDALGTEPVVIEIQWKE